jgi:hypothetical protein
MQFISNICTLYLFQDIKQRYDQDLEDKEDIQQLRLAVENAKIQLTVFPHAVFNLRLRTIGHFTYKVVLLFADYI